MIASSIAALTLGLAAGLSPGPLLTLVVSETMMHNRRSGFKVAIAPLLTDVPIIFATYSLLSLSTHPMVLTVLSFIGVVYIFYLGIQNIMFKTAPLSIDKKPERSLQKAIIVNFLNPNPYIFWSAVGTPLLKKATLPESLVFLLLFYSTMVGCKILLAIGVEKSRHVLQKNGYIWIIRITGIVLIAFACSIIISDIW